MATGDDALAAGIPVMTGTEPANTLDTEINLTRDVIAQRTNAVTPVAKGGTGTSNVYGVTRTSNASGVMVVAPDGTIARGSGALSDAYIPNGMPRAKIANLDSNLNSLAAAASSAQGAANSANVTATSAFNGGMNPGIYNRGTSGAYRNLSIQADGVLAHTASAARFKENVETLDIADDQVQALRVVEFDWIASGYRDVGLIADEVEAAGLGQFVFHDDDGEVLGIHYDRVNLALLPAVQRLLDRVQALEEGT